MTLQRSPSGIELVDALRAAIVRGDYSPNERLVEGDLAQAFEASRGAVRTALMELSLEGLVEREANRGARVRSLSQAEAIEIAEVRLAVEGLLAAKVAAHASPAEVAELRAVIDAMAVAVGQSDVISYSELNLVLHRRIREMAGHLTASRIVERMRNQSVRTQFRLSLLPGRLSTSLGEHQSIVEAIARHDAPSAEAAMRAHLSSVVASVRAMDPDSLR